MKETESSERKLVLEMLADGKISVEDAGRLLDKLQEIEGRQPQDSGREPIQRPRPKHLRILATDESGEEGLNMRIPLGLIRAGLALDSFLPTWARSRIIVGTSFSELNTVDSEYLRENLDDLDLTFDSEDGSETIHLFVE